MERPTRRNALKGGLAALAGLVGVGAASRVGRGDPAPAAGRPATLRLHARDLVAFSGGRRVVRSPSEGETATARADLFDGPDGRRVGEVHVASLPVHGPGTAAPDVGAMEWHTFHLDGGTIIGTGSAGTERGAFAIVGGTGRFANARGTYDLTRDGAAVEFVLRLSP
jgi:hypothetical protein